MEGRRMSNKPENKTSDFTDKDAITAGRMVGSGKTWLDVVRKLYPDSEYPELLAEITRERFLHWYKLQTPERLMEVLS